MRWLYYLKPRFIMRWQYADMATYPRQWIEHGEGIKGYRWFLSMMGFQAVQAKKINGRWFLITAIIKEVK